MKNFTIAFNSRKRPILLKAALDSLISNAEDFSQIEIIVRIDDDDIESKTLLESYGIRHKIGPRPINLDVSQNEVFGLGSGRFLCLWNDDAQMLTKGWDKIAFNKFEEFKVKYGIFDDILYGATRDTSADKMGNYASFPIISRQHLEILGFVVHKDFVGLGGDAALYNLYSRLPNRVVDLKEVEIAHVLHDTIEKVCKPDDTATTMRQNSAKYFVNPHYFDISKEAKKLNHFIQTR